MMIYDDHVDRLNCCSTMFYFFDLLLVALAGAFVYIPSCFFFKSSQLSPSRATCKALGAAASLPRSKRDSAGNHAHMLRQRQAVLMSIKRGRCADADG